MATTKRPERGWQWWFQKTSIVVLVAFVSLAMVPAMLFILTRSAQEQPEVQVEVSPGYYKVLEINPVPDSGLKYLKVIREEDVKKGVPVHTVLSSSSDLSEGDEVRILSVGIEPTDAEGLQISVVKIE